MKAGGPYLHGTGPGDCVTVAAAMGSSLHRPVTAKLAICVVYMQDTSGIACANLTDTAALPRLLPLASPG